MNGVMRFCVVALVICGSAASAFAQNSLPEIITMMSGAEELKNDLKYMVELGDAKDKGQWDNLSETLNTFLPGIDPAKPIRIDLLLDNDKLSYRPHFPIININAFLKENLVGFGINAARRGRNFWSLQGAGFRGFMRFDNGYASIAEEQEYLPAKLPDPALALAPLVEKNFDLGALIRNTKTAEADIQSRRDAVEKLRKEFLALLKPLEGETDQQFTMRKLVAEHQFDEIERFIVESKELVVGWTTDVEQKVGAVDFNLTALPGTSLEKSIQQLAENRGLFQSMERSENAIISIKGNFPLDEMRQKHLNESLDQGKTVAEAKIDAAADLSDSEKTAAKNALTLFIQLLKDGTAMGVVDGYGEIITEGENKHGLLGGIHLPENGEKTVREILALLPDLKEGNTIEFDVEKVGDVSLHKAHIVSGGLSLFEQWLGSEVDVWFATGPQTGWIAEGADAQEKLKAAIQKVTDDAETEISPTVIDFYLQVKPWLDLHAERGATDPTRKDLRDLIQNAFVPGEDTVTFTLARADDAAEAKFRAHQGFLRLIGKFVADFSAENLR